MYNTIRLFSVILNTTLCTEVAAKSHGTGLCTTSLKRLSPSNRVKPKGAVPFEITVDFSGFKR